MKIPIFQVDAFTDKLFKGSPAAVCLLDDWLEDSILQSIAAENNLSETAFVKGRHIRWFTPTMEVDLCGHATLAAACIIFHLNRDLSRITFYSKSGYLNIDKESDLYHLDFPKDPPQAIDEILDVSYNKNNAILNGFKAKDDILYLLKTEEDIRDFIPNFEIISSLNSRGLIITAKGNHCDFVSRFFGPNCGVPEDPVTGSAHTVLAPFWASRFGKNELSAQQLSSRGGDLRCKITSDRVIISGKAKIVVEGTFNLE